MNEEVSKQNNSADQDLELLRLANKQKSLRLLAAGFGLCFIHLFWYGSPWTAWLGLICYAPFMAWLREYSKRPFLAGLTFGYFYALMNAYWLGQFVGRWTESVLIGGFVILVVGTVWGCFYGLACWIRTKFRIFDYQMVFALLVFAMEMARMNIPQLEFPFTPIGEPLIAYWPLANVFKSANLCCAMTLVLNAWASILILVFNTQRLKEMRSSLPALVGRFAMVGLLAIGIGLILPKQTSKPLGVKVALGQLGTDLAYGSQMTEFMRVQRAGDALINQAEQAGADLLILPEGVTSFANLPSTPFQLKPNLKTLFGAQRGTGPRYQSAYMWSGHGFKYTDKNRLVVFGEYVPFRGIIPYPKGFQLPSGDLAAGTERHLLDVKPGVTVGAMICFESLFASSAQDFEKLNPSFLAVMSLDDWYVGTNAIPRLQIAARWRAVETKKWLLRVGSLGKTMVINPRGEVTQELPVGERALLVVEL